MNESPDTHLGQVTHLTESSILALKNEITNGDASRVQLHNQRGQHIRRHAGLRSVRLTHDRGHCFSHVRARIEDELNERNLTDAARFNVLDAIHILERQLELVDEQTFHLSRVHAAVVAEDDNLRLIDWREDIHPHAREGQAAAGDQRHDHHHRGDRVPHSKDNKVHSEPPRSSSRSSHSLVTYVASACRSTRASTKAPVAQNATWM